MTKKETRKVLHATFMKESIHYALTKPTHYAIEQEKGTIVKYERTKISFNTLHSPTQWSWH
jgi:hypothetical protein